jgi:hypothetical protein
MTMTTDIVLSEAQKIGGAVMLIVADRTELARFTNGEIDDETALGIVKMVEENLSLNTEKRLAALVWLASFHGEVIDQWLVDINEEYSPEDVLLAIDLLYEVGIRTRKGGLNEESTNMDSRDSVVSLLDFLKTYTEYQSAPELHIHSVERLWVVIEELGGLDEVLNIDNVDTLEDKYNDTDDEPGEETDEES